jgi:hypothetical protein
MPQEDLYKYLSLDNISIWNEYLHVLKSEEEKEERDKLESENVEDYSKLELYREIKRLKGRVEQLEVTNEAHIDKIEELKIIRDNLHYKLKEAEETNKKELLALRNQTVEGLYETLNDLYFPNHDAIDLARKTIAIFMNYGTMDALNDIPDKYHLREAVLKLRYMRVAKGLSTHFKV